MPGSFAVATGYALGQRRPAEPRLHAFHHGLVGVEAAHHVVIAQRDPVAFPEVAVAHHMASGMPLVDDHGPLQQRLYGNRSDRLVVGSLVGRQEDKALVAEHLGHDARLGRLVLENGEVELAVLELLNELGLVAGVQVHPSLGILAHVERHETREEGHAVGVAHPHGDVGREMLVDSGDLGSHDALHVGHVLSEFHGHLARLREGNAGGGPVDERRAELFLDGGNFLRQAGARHVQLAGCLREALRLRKNEQNLDIVEQHEPSSSAVTFRIAWHRSSSDPARFRSAEFTHTDNH